MALFMLFSSHFFFVIKTIIFDLLKTTLTEIFQPDTIRLVFAVAVAVFVRVYRIVSWKTEHLLCHASLLVSVANL